MMEEKKKGLSTVELVAIVGGVSIVGLVAIVFLVSMAFDNSESARLTRDVAETMRETRGQQTKKSAIEITPPSYTPDPEEAWIAAQKAVETQLKSPETAQYGKQSAADGIAYKGSQEYVANGWVDSKEGKKVTRKKWSVRVADRGNQEWAIVDGPHFLEPSEEDKIKAKIAQNGREGQAR